jgi:hypothetical protein
MKNFNEWLSFRSNSYQESEGQESDSAFDFRSMPGNVSSTVSRAAGRFKGMVDKYGGAKKIKNKRIVLADLIKDVYDFSDPSQLSKLKTDLRTLLNHLEVNNNLDVENDENDENDEINEIDDELDQDK